MKRVPTQTLGLKHLAFFEAVGEAEENSTKAYSATAGLLMLRLIDHWVLAGPVMVEPESVSVRSVRGAIMQLESNDPSREVLFGLVNAMQTVREVDLPPMLPRLFAYAGCLEKRTELKLAADVYTTIARLAEEDYDADLLIDSFLRLGYCQRNLGVLAEAEASYMMAGKVAKRQKHVARALRSQIGVAIVTMTRGNLPKADELLANVVLECERTKCAEVIPIALHSHSVVAQRRGDLGRAVCLAYDALQHATIPNDRDLILGDLGAYFVVMERFDAARDALMILEATAMTETVRVNARANMLVLAARSGDRELFSSSRAQLASARLTVEARVNFLIESARGLRKFGEPETAIALLEEARDLASANGFNRSVFEADEMLAQNDQPVQVTDSGARFEDTDAAEGVALELKKMALAVSES
jgi:tetratricopeptide (TPR) repeat protein